MTIHSHFGFYHGQYGSFYPKQGTNGGGYYESAHGIGNKGSGEFLGGYGGDSFLRGGNGGVGLTMYGQDLFNYGKIIGGDGGSVTYYAAYPGTEYAGAGGNGVSLLGTGDYLSNTLIITGGNGGYSYSGYGGTGGDGVYAENAGIHNYGTITGGDGGDSETSHGGTGGYGVDLKGSTLTNAGSIDGGSGGISYASLNIGGYGGSALYAEDTKVYNKSTIQGGSGQTGYNGGGGALGAVLLGGTYFYNENGHSIIGGNGGGTSEGHGGAGGYGVYLGAGTTLKNNGAITGGAGGSSASGKGGNGGFGLLDIDANVTIDAGGSITGGAGGDSVSGQGGNGGLGVYLGGAALTDAGVITGGAGGDGTTQGVAGYAVEFGRSPASLILDPTASFTGMTIGGFHHGDSITLEGVTTSLAEFVSGEGLYLTNGDVIDLVGDFSTGSFSVTDTGGNTVITDIPCFASGTKIQTPYGETPVENLRVGDLVTLHQGGSAEIIWSGSRTVDLRRHPTPEKAQPIRILAHAFGPHLPARDLRLSPDHALFLDGHLIEAKTLVNGATIIRETDTSSVTYHHIELARHNVLLAEGIPAESFLDSGNRAMFADQAQPMALHPDFVAQCRASACAPLAVDGPVVLAVRTRLLERARNRGFTATDAIDLKLQTGTTRLLPIATSTPTHLQFTLPPGLTELVLHSSSGVPAELSADPGDRRVLGAAIAALTLIQNGIRHPIALDNPAHQGFHPAEPTHRWTNGAARIALPAYSGPTTLEVAVNGQMARWSTPPVEFSTCA